MARISLAIAVRGACDARTMWERLGGWPPVDAHFAFDDDSALVGKPDWVKAHRCEGGSIFSYWGEAIARCDGDYVAVMSPYLVPAQGWLEAMAVASTSGERAYFGPVEEGYARGDPAIIGYLVEYGHFHRPTRGDHGEIPGTNVIIRSDQLPDQAALLQDGFTKTALLEGWTRVGYRPAYVADAVAVHERPFDIRAYRQRRYLHGRAYGATRRRALGLPATLIAIAKTVLLPFVRVARIRARVRHVPHVRRAVRQHFWTILRSEAAWSAGEFAGLATADPGDQALLD